MKEHYERSNSFNSKVCVITYNAIIRKRFFILRSNIRSIIRVTLSYECFGAISFFNFDNTVNNHNIFIVSISYNIIELHLIYIFVLLNLNNVIRVELIIQIISFQIRICFILLTHRSRTYDHHRLIPNHSHTRCKSVNQGINEESSNNSKNQIGNNLSDNSHCFSSFAFFTFVFFN